MQEVECLIIENKVAQIHQVIEILKPYSYHMHIAKTRAFALSLIHKQVPEIILLGEIEGDRLSFIQELQQKVPASRIIVLGLEGISDEELKVGEWDYVNTPIQEAELRTRLRVQQSILAREIEAKAAREALEEFCRSVSHDLRSHVNVIKEISVLLQAEFNEGLPAEGQGLLSHLVSKAGDLNEMLERLLLFSRVGRKQLEKEAIDLNKVFEEKFAQLKPANQMVQMTLGELPVIQGDGYLIDLLVEEILHNGIKFSAPMAPGCICVTGKVEEGHATILVEDQGVGFEMAYVHKLFKVFERLHTQEEFGGCGMGLAIVQKIIARHGGEISITSQIKKGTQVKFCVPQ